MQSPLRPEEDAGPPGALFIGSPLSYFLWMLRTDTYPVVVRISFLNLTVLCGNVFVSILGVGYGTVCPQPLTINSCSRRSMVSASCRRFNSGDPGEGIIPEPRDGVRGAQKKAARPCCPWLLLLLLSSAHKRLEDAGDNLMMMTMMTGLLPRNLTPLICRE